ncbi:MAG TPA: sigma-70 family RNA polymerase sigma factor [Pyrinomonadaceae bacterium]|nr:sigma-70 family RNA polymerase sigma factor [Pyrinomonadaceae bacterium]
MTESEDALIGRAQAGDAEAFCRLAREYERRVYALALHFCRDPSDAEDLSQEVWLKAFRALRTFRREASFYTWLRQITVNTFLNRARETTYVSAGEKTRVRLEELDAADAPNGNQHARGDAEQSIEQKILVRRVLDALGELTPQQRLMFLLKHREGMTYQEIAGAMNCSAGAVKKTLFRVILKLRATLGVEAEGETVSVAAREGV